MLNILWLFSIAFVALETVYWLFIPGDPPITRFYKWWTTPPPFICFGVKKYRYHCYHIDPLSRRYKRDIYSDCHAPVVEHLTKRCCRCSDAIEFIVRESPSDSCD